MTVESEESPSRWWLGPALGAALGLVVGTWYGEAVHVAPMEPFVGPARAAAVVWVATLIAHRFVDPDLAKRIDVTALVATLALIVGSALSAARLRDSFNTAVASMPALQQALEQEKASTGEYPASIGHLPAVDSVSVPLLRPTVLHYERTSTGYSVTVSDWLVTHEMNEASSPESWK